MQMNELEYEISIAIWFFLCSGESPYKGRPYDDLIIQYQTEDDFEIIYKTTCSIISSLNKDRIELFRTRINVGNRRIKFINITDDINLRGINLGMRFFVGRFIPDRNEWFEGYIEYEPLLEVK